MRDKGKRKPLGPKEKGDFSKNVEKMVERKCKMLLFL